MPRTPGSATSPPALTRRTPAPGTVRPATAAPAGHRHPGRLPGAELEAPVCATCGTQFPPGARPDRCPICLDERQYVGWEGQSWTSIRQLRGDGRTNRVKEVEPGLVGIGTEPRFAIGQRALLLRTPRGNVLWDCTSYLDPATLAEVDRLGGLRAIAISHPHYHSSMVTWSRAFGDVPIYLHEDVRRWVVRPDERIVFWRGEEEELPGGLRLVRTGGHYEGFQVLHWPAGAAGRGVLLTGDQPFVCADRRWLSFMYSYPNYLPLPPAAVDRIVDALRPLAYDRIYGAWWDRVVERDAKAAVERSRERYLAALGAAPDGGGSRQGRSP